MAEPTEFPGDDGAYWPLRDEEGVPDPATFADEIEADLKDAARGIGPLVVRQATLLAQWSAFLSTDVAPNDPTFRRIGDLLFEALELLEEFVKGAENDG